MERRTYLSIVGLATAGISAGCMSGGDGDGRERDVKTLDLGDDAELGNVDVSVEAVKMFDAEDVKNLSPSSDDSKFVFVKVKIKQDGDGPGKMPYEGTEPGDLGLFYEGKHVTTVFEEDEVEADGTKYKAFGDSIQGAELSPNEDVERWMVYSVPSGYSKDDSYVQLKDLSESSDTVYRWKLG
ncbi:MAG: hypothetical protein ABEK59_11480 [Halobacteria archaeon]